jgi:hypothetical protein
LSRAALDDGSATADTQLRLLRQQSLSLEYRTTRLDVPGADAATHAGCGRGVLRPKAALHAGGTITVHRPHIR